MASTSAQRQIEILKLLEEHAKLLEYFAVEMSEQRRRLAALAMAASTANKPTLLARLISFFR